MVCELCGGRDVTRCIVCGTRICWNCGEKLLCTKCQLLELLLEDEKSKEREVRILNST